MNRLSRLVLGAAAIGLLGAGTATDTQAQHFKGKTITLIVGFTAGGTDLTARVLARHIGRHIPGNPNIIVKNMPGAGSLKAQNFIFEKAPPDGSVLSFNPFVPFGQLMKSPGVRFKYEEFTAIGGLINPPNLVFARTDIVPGGLKSAADLVKAESLRWTGRRPTNSNDLFGRLGLEMLGIKYVYVPGYRGIDKLRASLMTNETNITGIGTTGWTSQIKSTIAADGTVKLLWYRPSIDKDGNLVGHPDIPKGTPSFVEVYKQVKGKAPSGPVWEAYKMAIKLGAVNFQLMGPPDMNPEATTALRQGFANVVKDKALQAEQRKVLGTVQIPATPADMARAHAGLKGVSPEMMAFWKKHFAEGRGKKGK